MWWLAPSPHSKRVPGLNPSWSLSVWSSSLCMLWVLFGYSSFLPLSKNMHVRLIGVSKFISQYKTPFLLIFTSSVSTPHRNQGLYPHPAMTGVQLVRGWGSLWLWKKRWLLWCEEQ